MKGSLTTANLITSGSLAAGFLALILAAQDDYTWAAGAVGVAAVLDSVDGLVARRTNTECELGSELDSLADLVSFGVAPALIMYLSTLHSLPVAGVGACIAFLLCGAWRLARFQTGERSPHYFVGLSIPPGRGRGGRAGSHQPRARACPRDGHHALPADGEPVAVPHFGGVRSSESLAGPGQGRGGGGRVGSRLGVDHRGDSAGTREHGGAAGEHRE